MADFKPAFTISDNQILFKLHNAALDKAQKLMNDKIYNKKDSLVNSGCPIRTDVKKAFDNSKSTYEVGLACFLEELKGYKKLEDKKITADKDVQDKLVKQNEKLLKELRKNAYGILIEYFKTFAGSENASKVKEDDLTQHFYYGLEDATGVKNYVIGNQESINKDKNAVSSASSTGSFAKQNTASSEYSWILYKFQYTVGLNRK